MEEKEIKEIIAYAIDYCQRKGTNISTQEVFDEYIKGTEDEKIKKALIHLVTANKELYSGIDNFDGIKWTILQEWLERQRNQNPTDNFKPKFHEFDKCVFNTTKFKVGDWVTDGEHKYKIVGICDWHWYNMVSYDGTEKKSDTVIRVNQYFHLWTIKDAEDGDILVESKCDVILMFRGIGNTEWNDVIDYHCCYDCYRKVFIVQKDLEHWGDTENNQLEPATKEQRDLLFQKMKEAGYAFDFKNKELKKIEQKTA